MRPLLLLLFTPLKPRSSLPLRTKQLSSFPFTTSSLNFILHTCRFDTTVTMALLSSPYKASRAGSISPLPPVPPPKAIDLNSSTRSTDRETGHKITKRAFHCDLIVENDDPETLELVQLLGEPLEPITSLPRAGPSRPVTAPLDSSSPHKQDDKRYASLVEELVRTEKSYLSRLRALKINYADPLREFAKDRNTQIIPLYEAKNLFSNIDQIVNASAAFLSDLEAMAEKGEISIAADICVRHVSEPWYWS